MKIKFKKLSTHLSARNDMQNLLISICGGWMSS